MVIGPDYQGGRIGQGNQAAQPGQGLVDSTVQEKAIAYPTDSKLLNRGRQQLVQLVAEAGITLRQNYNRVAPKLAGKIARAMLTPGNTSACVAT